MPADMGSKSRKKRLAKPPRPANQFIIYRTSMKDAVRAENPAASNIEICESSTLGFIVISFHISGRWAWVTDCQTARIIGAKWRALGDNERAIWKEKQTLVRAAHEKAYPNYKYTPRATRNQKTDAGDTESGHARQSKEWPHTPERDDLKPQGLQISAIDPTISLQQAYEMAPYPLLKQMPGQMDDQEFDQVCPQMPEQPTPQTNEEKLDLMLGDILGEGPAPTPETANEQSVHQTLGQVYEQEPEQVPFADQYLPTVSQNPECFEDQLDIFPFIDLDIDPLA